MGDLQERGRRRGGVRPHDGVHPEDDRHAQAHGRGGRALAQRLGGDGVRAARGDRRDAAARPVQLPLQRDVRRAHPRAADGQRGRDEAARDRSGSGLGSGQA